jgi:hypothetical protein
MKYCLPKHRKNKVEDLGALDIKGLLLHESNSIDKLTSYRKEAES